MLCAAANTDQLESAARRLMTTIHGSSFDLGEAAGIPLRVSVGGALVSEHDMSERQAVERADEAMYDAKRPGRDSLVISRL